MIVDSMSYEEIAQAMHTDWKNELQNGYNTCFGQKAKYYDYVKKHLSLEEFHYFGKREKVTRTNNTWIFYFFTHGRREALNSGLSRVILLKYHRHDGWHYVQMHPQRQSEITFFVPHFFQRYEERMHLNDGKQGKQRIDPVKEFFMRTEAVAGGALNNPKYPGGIFLTSEEGVSLGANLGNNMWECRTFVPYDMLKDDQVSRTIQDQETLDAIRELCREGLMDSPHRRLKALHPEIKW